MNPSIVLAGRVAMVTGAARRVGAAIVRGFHSEGANVVIHCRRSLREAELLCAELNRARADSAATVSADLLDLASAPLIVERALSAFGRLDVLVNNASTFYPRPSERSQRRIGMISSAAICGRRCFCPRPPHRTCAARRA